MNRVEVFDIQKSQFIASIKVGQLPRSIALSPDGGTLYVANSGGENISSLEVEDALCRHPAVMMCAVVAQPDPA